MIARLADHLAHFLPLASPADRDARWDQACADVEAVRRALAAPAPGAIVGDAEAAEMAARAKARLVFDGPPGPGGPRFVEVEDEDGAGLRWGDWIKCPDGDMWALVPYPDVDRLLADRAARIAEREALLGAFRTGKADALRAVAAVLDADPDCTGPLGRGEVLLVAARLRRMADDAEKGA